MLSKLFVCNVGVLACFLLNGIVLETITNIFGKKVFTFNIFMVLLPCFFNFAFAGCALFAKTRLTTATITTTTKTATENVPKYLYFICGFLVMLSLLCANGSLAYITYPSQVLMKTLKPIPILLCGAIGARKSYPVHRFVTTMFIVGGVVVFMYDQHSLTHNNKNNKNDNDDNAQRQHQQVKTFPSLMTR